MAGHLPDITGGISRDAAGSPERKLMHSSVEDGMGKDAVSRRRFVAGILGTAGLALGGCSQTDRFDGDFNAADTDSARYAHMYRAMPEERFPIPAVDLRQVNPRYYRQVVVDPTGERPGTVVVDTSNRFLYLVQENGKALRYGVGIGRDGFEWSGRARIAWKRAWPTWTPPAEMIEREPRLEEWRNGMPPSLDNPLGARALYIFEGNRDTLYRLHGTMEFASIGKAVSSGCVRLLNQDIIDLYNRVPKGTPILVA